MQKVELLKSKFGSCFSSLLTKCISLYDVAVWCCEWDPSLSGTAAPNSET
jgi:hypothetical protein